MTASLVGSTLSKASWWHQHDIQRAVLKGFAFKPLRRAACAVRKGFIDTSEHNAALCFLSSRSWPEPVCALYFHTVLLSDNWKTTEKKKTALQYCMKATLRPGLKGGLQAAEPRQELARLSVVGKCLCFILSLHLLFSSLKERNETGESPFIYFF